MPARWKSDSKWTEPAVGTLPANNIPLRLKYREAAWAKKTPGNYSGNSGVAKKKGFPPPVGLRSRPKASSQRKRWGKR